MNCDTWILLIFSIIALFFSFFYGAKSIDIFVTKNIDDEKPKRNKYWYRHQFWFNFLGSLVGWVALWMLLPKPVSNFFYSIQNGTANTSFSNILLFFLFFIGVTGYLPVTIVGVISSIGELFKKAIDKLKM